MTTIAVFNRKGGVGKTTTAVNIAFEFAQRGYRTLLIDVDAQANATTAMGLVEGGVDQWLGGDDVQVQSAHGVDVLGADEYLEDYPQDLAPNRKLWTCMRDRLDAHEYDIVIIDCPPALNLLTVQSLIAADHALIPLVPAVLSVIGLARLKETIDEIRALNKRLSTPIAVFCQYDGRQVLSRQIIRDVRRSGQSVADTVIRRNVAVKESVGFGEPIGIYKRRSNGARDYRKLTDELEQVYGLTPPEK